jgi:hypothetical protein
MSPAAQPTPQVLAKVTDCRGAAWGALSLGPEFTPSPASLQPALPTSFISTWSRLCALTNEAWVEGPSSVATALHQLNTELRQVLFAGDSAQPYTAQHQLLHLCSRHLDMLQAQYLAVEQQQQQR